MNGNNPVTVRVGTGVASGARKTMSPLFDFDTVKAVALEARGAPVLVPLTKVAVMLAAGA